MGEAAKNISDELKDRHSDIEWKKIARMRDKLIHFYFGVNLDIVWDVAKNKVPVLRNKISDIVWDVAKNKVPVLRNKISKLLLEFE